MKKIAHARHVAVVAAGGVAGVDHIWYHDDAVCVLAAVVMTVHDPHAQQAVAGAAAAAAVGAALVDVKTGC